MVAEQEEVTRGQVIAKSDGFLSVPIHSPATGIVRRIGYMPTIRGKMEPGIFLSPHPASTQEPMSGNGIEASASRETILAAIQQTGVVGLGGAGFPTHAKLTIPDGSRVETVVVNGAECEPLLTTDHRVMLEYAADIIRGIPYVLRATAASRANIAVEANKLDAAKSLRAAIPPGAPISVTILPVKYPQGAEKVLVQSVLHREIPGGRLPVDVHAICINVRTVAELGRLLPSGRGLQERIITVSGPGVLRPGNYRIPIGTTLRFILETVGTSDRLTSVVMGGPMMGTAASSLDIPVTKGSTGVIAFTDQGSERHEYPCIRCGYCLDACPLFLNPAKLGLLARAGEFEQMASQYHLKDCFECGCCTYVCPAHLPLVQSFRVAKAAIRKEAAK